MNTSNSSGVWRRLECATSVAAAEGVVALCTRTVFTTARSISANSTPRPLMMRKDIMIRKEPVKDTEEGT